MATWLGALGAGHGGRLVRKGSPTMWSTAGLLLLSVVRMKYFVVLCHSH